MDMSIRSGSQLVTRPGRGNELATRQRRWSNYDVIIASIVGHFVASRFLTPSPFERLYTLDRYLLVGSMAGVEVPQLRAADDDTQIEMMSTQIAHPVIVYDLDSGERIIMIP
jgi:hypothetical protein